MARKKKEAKIEQKFYNGNKNIPLANNQFEWTDEMLLELDACTNNIIEFSKKFTIVHPDLGKHQIKVRDYQERILKMLEKNRFGLVLSGRQSGKTTVVTIYALHNLCFKNDQRVLIVANKEDTAIEILKRIRMAYEGLPNHLKPGIVNYSKTSIDLENGSSCTISSTSSSSGRGTSVNVLIIDEMAFVDAHVMDEFWSSVYPIISSSKTAKIFSISTPNKKGNLFHDLYEGSTKTGEEWNGWASEKVTWTDVPGRDEAWKQDQIKRMGKDGVNKFRQEFNCEFLDDNDSVGSSEDEILELSKHVREPLFVSEKEDYKMWATVKEKHFYSIGVDVAEGVGSCNSTIQVFDITDLTNIEQVAEFASNRINIYNFASKINEIGLYWNKALVLVERNSFGGQVLDQLREKHKYERIGTFNPNNPSEKLLDFQIQSNRIGVFSNQISKNTANVNRLYWFFSVKSVKIRSAQLLSEVKTYVKHANGTWKKQTARDFDDRIEAVNWALFALHNPVCETYFSVEEYDTNNKPLKIFPSDGISESIGMFGTEGVRKHGQKAEEDWDYMDIQVDTPSFIGFSRNGGNADMDHLMDNGWEVVGYR